jgi:hypothetical protein
MSSSEAAHPDPSVVPQNPSEAKGAVEPVQPGQSPALNKVPNEVKSTLTKADETLIRFSKYGSTGSDTAAQATDTEV